MTVRFYFDTNVYRHVSQCGEAESIAQLLARSAVILLASSSNLLETYGISDSLVRDREMRVLTRMAREFERYPQSWHEALELRHAIRRHRRNWLRPVAFERHSRFFLEQHRAKWQAALDGEYPDPDSYARFRRDFEAGVRQRGDFQKTIRLERLNTAVSRMIVDTQSGRLSGTALDLTDPEVFWRVECLLSWSEAILNENSSSRDLRDWLSPYLKSKAFEADDYPAFWMKDVGTDEVPRNRLTSLVSFYQLDSKVTHGNAEDSQHACHALEVDYFFTADRAFYDALVKVSRHFPRFARLVLVDRVAPSAMSYLGAVLEGISLSPPARTDRSGT